MANEGRRQKGENRQGGAFLATARGHSTSFIRTTRAALAAVSPRPTRPAHDRGDTVATGSLDGGDTVPPKAPSTKSKL